MRRSVFNAKLMVQAPAYRRKKMKQYLFLTSALVVSGLLSGVVEAACIQTPTCSSLGYTSSQSCSGGIKCPFGNAWNCTLINKITEIEKKVTEIINNGGGSSGSNTNNDFSSCKIGDILYSDMSCNADVIANKTPIAVIFDTTNGLAVALESKYLRYIIEPANDFGQIDVPGVSNSTELLAGWMGKKYTQATFEYCQKNGKNCPAVEYVMAYKTDGTKAGDWYIPAIDELKAVIANNDKISTALTKMGKESLETHIWSSTLVTTNESVWEYVWQDGQYESFLVHKDLTRPVRLCLPSSEICNVYYGEDDERTLTSYTYPVINYKEIGN